MNGYAVTEGALDQGKERHFPVRATSLSILRNSGGSAGTGGHMEELFPVGMDWDLEGRLGL